MRRTAAAAMRRTQLLRVISVEGGDAVPPDRPPDLSHSGPWVRERMLQMRKSLGMSEAEIDSMLLQHGPQAAAGDRAAIEGGGGGGADAATPAAAASGDAVAETELPRAPTWKEIVEAKEREGALFAPRTVREAFPYLTQQPAGVPEFGDRLRKEQMLAHIEAQSNNPMDVMVTLQMERIYFTLRVVVSCVLGYAAVGSYLWWHEYDSAADANLDLTFAQFPLSDQEARQRVEMREEPLVPVFRHDSLGYKCVWTPQSKAQHMMWHERHGDNQALDIQGGSYKPATLSGRSRFNVTYPGHLAPLVGSPEDQHTYQRMVRDQLQSGAVPTVSGGPY